MVKKVAVIGSGIMGQGITQVFIKNGIDTLLIDIDKTILENAKNSISDGKFGLSRLVEKGAITENQKNDYMNNLKTSTDYAMLNDCEFVIEAVPEILSLKLKVMESVEKNLPETSIIASNTSGIMISEIGMNIKNKSRLIGMHWFNPAPVMKLIEVVKTRFTSESTINTVMELSRSLGKEPVLVKDYPGFFTTNFVHSWIVESLRLYEKGIASKEDIDKMAKLGFGFPMGPFELMDTIGLDTMMEIGNYLYSETGDEKMLPPPMLKEMVYAGYKGNKKIKMNSKGGWYDVK
uniref:3-hydroxyacyl-CoA dehydrogenase NAD-binding domain-containing protein n=1 Tax=Ferroplasma sp. TaxID=2591003 RepID=UPI00307E7E9F